MGLDVTNKIFAENAWYFRNALVRANYTNIEQGICETTEFLECFLRNLLLGEKNNLRNRYMHIRWNEEKQDIEDKKQDIENRKQDIGAEKQNLIVLDSVGNKTKDNIMKLFAEYGYDSFFGRTEVMRLLGLTASPSSELIKKMLNMGLIYPMKGKGKGKYLFKRDKT